MLVWLGFLGMCGFSVFLKLADLRVWRVLLLGTSVWVGLMLLVLFLVDLFRLWVGRLPLVRWVGVFMFGVLVLRVMCSDVAHMVVFGLRSMGLGLSGLGSVGWCDIWWDFLVLNLRCRVLGWAGSVLFGCVVYDRLVYVCGLG